MTMEKQGSIRSGRYRHIIWDWNGTLLNDSFLCVEVLNSMLGRRGLPLVTEDSYRETFDFPVVRYYEQVGFDFRKEPFEMVSTQFVSAFLEGFPRCELHVGVTDVLTSWAQSGIGHSVLSASEQNNLHVQVNHHQLARHFIALNGIDTIHAPGKTARGMEWIQALGIPPEEVLLIGDTLHDHEVAEAMGTDCVLLAHGHQSAVRLGRRGATVVATLQDLIQSTSASDGWLKWKGSAKR